MNTTRTNWNQLRCADCGENLDHFGICPNADPRKVVRQTSPVYCEVQEVMKMYREFTSVSSDRKADI